MHDAVTFRRLLWDGGRVVGAELEDSNGAAIKRSATVVVGVGVGVGVGVAVGVVTTVFVVVSDAASVGLALLVPHADARVSSPRAATLSDRCARM